MNEAHRNLLVVLSGPSGVGKDSILDELQRRGHNFHRVVTTTTRDPRPGEQDGVDYFFLTVAEFQGLISEGDLLEHAIVYGHHYGVPRAQVFDALARGLDVYVRTDVQGAASIKIAMPAAVLVFIAPANIGEIEGRMRARGDEDEDKIQRRIATASSEMERIGEFEHVVINAPGRLDDAVTALERILATERAAPAG